MALTYEMKHVFFFFEYPNIFVCAIDNYQKRLEEKGTF